jgi:hypothetical protein
MPLARRRNPASPDKLIARDIIADADTSGPFYEDLVQPLLAAWAEHAAGALESGKRVPPIAASVWSGLAQVWAENHGMPALTSAQASAAGRALQARFQPEADGYIDAYLG